MNEQLRETSNGRFRCWWPGDDAQYIEYHDTEWGRPVLDDARLFETICLESFQAGLSWLIILRKRDNFRRAFSHFDMDTVALFSDGDIDRLVADTGIVRHRGKIEATINNAARALELIESGTTLREYFWGFASQACSDEDQQVSPVPELSSVPPIACALSKDLKKRGWKFVGPTTVHSFMQSTGLINDHLVGCLSRSPCEDERRRTMATLINSAD